MVLQGLGEKAVWSGGELSKDGDANAKVYVFSGTAFTIQSDALGVGATLIIGESPTAAPSPGTVNLAKADGTRDLAGHLTLSKDANILVKPQGTLNLNQTVESSTKGGIVAATGSTSAVDNKGTIVRTAVDNDPTQFLKIGVKVTNSGGGARFILEKNTQINFAGEFDLNTGQYEPKDGCITDGKINRNGGKLVFKDGGAAGRYHVYFIGELSGGSGDIEFVQTTPDAYGTVHIAGDLGLASGVTLNVDGSTEGVCDTFEVGGRTTISGAVMSVYTQTMSPPTGYRYTFLTSAGGTSGLGWLSPVTSLGPFPADYVFDTNSRLRVV